MEGNYVNRNNSHLENLGFEEHSWGTSWPARNYACSFCKREFRSAQALGGHMNVHRRDRARLRSSLISSSSSSSSWNNISDQCPNNNIKPNPTNTTTTSLFVSPPSPLSNELLMNCSHPSSSSSSLFLTLSSSPSLPPNNHPFYDKKPRLTTTPSLSLPLLSPQRSEIMMMSKSTRRSTTTLGVEEMKGYEREVKMNNVFMNNEQNITLELGVGLFKHQQEEKLDLELRL